MFRDTRCCSLFMQKREAPGRATKDNGDRRHSVVAHHLRGVWSQQSVHATWDGATISPFISRGVGIHPMR